MKGWRFQHCGSMMNRIWSMMNFDRIVVGRVGKMGEKGKRKKGQR